MTNKIWVGPADGANHKPLTFEGRASSATILPGFLVERIATGFQNATTTERLLIAREVGEQFGKSITDSWTTDETMVAISPRSGEFFYVALAAAQTIEIGTPLASNNDGTFKRATGNDVILAYAQERSINAPLASLVLAFKE